MSRLSFIIALMALGTIANAKYFNTGLCKVKHCYCTEILHPFWTNINCTIPDGSKLNITKNDLPNTAIEFLIDGSDEVVFNEGSFFGAMDLHRITILNTKKIVFREFAAINFRAASIFLDIQDCDLLRFENGTFTQLGGPLTITIRNCDTMFIEGVSFSWVLKMEISNVRELTVGSGSFAMESSASNVGDHGPGLMIEMINVTIPQIPKSAFGSSAARLYMESVDIHSIETGAFSANTYNVVIAINCSLRMIEEEAFSEKSLINYLNLDGCKINHIKSQAMKSAIALIKIKQSSFDNIESGAINSTVASVIILDSVFHEFMENGFQFSSLNSVQMERCSFDDLPPNAIATPGASIHELIFIENEIETVHEDSLAFIGKAIKTHEIDYINNYYGEPCKCNVSEWIAKTLGVESGERFLKNSYCTVDEIIARCFNVKDLNMMAQQFVDKVCIDKSEIKCDDVQTTDGVTEIQNPRFPHKNTSEKGLSDRNKKVIGIVIVTCFGCVLIALIVSLIRWLNRRGYCFSIKNFFMSSNAPCCQWCVRVFRCGHSSGVYNASSISQFSVNEFSERHCLNDYRGQDRATESSVQDADLEFDTTEPSAPVPTIERCTQTIPEELTVELINNLRKKIEVPEKYGEAKQMIMHLYGILDIESPTDAAPEENIYELPFQTTTITVQTDKKKKKKKKKNVGTKVPSIEKLTPLSPYKGQTSLAHEYYQPKDLATHLYETALTHEYLKPNDLELHLYDEIIANDKEKKTFSEAMPDVIIDQPVPRGPYLQKVLSNPLSPKSSDEDEKRDMSLKSNSSIKSDKMKNRPLPKKPVVDPGEGTSTSTKHG